MKLKYYTVKIKNETFDLPKDMAIPQIGSVIFIQDKVGVVDEIKYHIVNKKIYMISITTNQKT